ncbi:unnamed protein product [Ranitomeya imitator]|uniref:UPAR/Ly6 domain-containing protein n=1 Tax=Ranitomeya imitator TaxID=111125 RepID=A0ABN9M0H1_9NEOB|nr:unnamed protein product [Ranitomeya imitator]
MGTGPLPGLLWVLSALVTPGDFLSCKVCTSTSAQLCNASSLVCPEGYVCASSYTLTNTLPDDNFQPNGLSCQTCLSVYSKWCYSKQTIDCTGEEDACLLQTSEYYAPIRRSIAIRGCATKSICSLGTQWIKFGTLKIKFKYSCVFSSTTSLQIGLVAPITVALAVVKYMHAS